MNTISKISSKSVLSLTSFATAHKLLTRLNKPFSFTMTAFLKAKTTYQSEGLRGWGPLAILHISVALYVQSKGLVRFCDFMQATFTIEISEPSSQK